MEHEGSEFLEFLSEICPSLKGEHLLTLAETVLEGKPLVLVLTRKQMLGEYKISAEAVEGMKVLLASESMERAREYLLRRVEEYERDRELR